MAADPDLPDGAASQQGYRVLPPPVRLEETIASVDPDPLPDPDAVRNVEQHRALRDD